MDVCEEALKACKCLYLEVQGDVADDVYRKVAALVAEIARLREERERKCRWQYDDNTEHWEGECGVAWCFTDGGLEDNDCVYCPKCGGRVAVAM